MGLNIHTLRLLFHAKQVGASLDRVITIGRLDVLMTPDQLDEEFASFGEPLKPGEAAELMHARDRFCEPIIERLGAGQVDSIDASDYEGATIVHDLNAPLGDEKKGRYSLLLDGGTLEHVFHFPEALRTCMSLIEVGGHVLFSLPANNEMGHGFYQFSPELFFRAFSKENGFEMKGLFLAPLYHDGTWLKVEDPASVRERVGYNQTVDELGVLVIAKRVQDVPIFAKPPQQSDYVAAWENSEGGNRLEFFDRTVTKKPSVWKRRAKAAIPKRLLWLRHIIVAGKYVSAEPDPRKFKIFDPRHTTSI